MFAEIFGLLQAGAVHRFDQFGGLGDEAALDQQTEAFARNEGSRDLGRGMFGIVARVRDGTAVVLIGVVRVGLDEFGGVPAVGDHEVEVVSTDAVAEEVEVDGADVSFGLVEDVEFVEVPRPGFGVHFVVLEAEEANAASGEADFPFCEVAFEENGWAGDVGLTDFDAAVDDGFDVLAVGGALEDVAGWHAGLHVVRTEKPDAIDELSGAEVDHEDVMELCGGVPVAVGEAIIDVAIEGDGEAVSVDVVCGLLIKFGFEKGFAVLGSVLFGFDSEVPKGLAHAGDEHRVEQGPATGGIGFSGLS